MIKKVLFVLLVVLNILLFCLIIWYWTAFKGKVLKPLQPDESAKYLANIIKNRFQNDLDSTVRYYVLAFIGKCDNEIAQNLKEYEELELPISIKLLFIFSNTDLESMKECKRNVSIKNIVLPNEAIQLARLASIPEYHSAIFILDMLNNTILTHYNYLLHSIILKELIESIKS